MEENNGWSDLIRAVTIMIAIVVIGTPLGLYLGYTVNRWWYALAIVCGLPGVLFLWERYVSRPQPIPGSEPEYPPKPEKPSVEG